MNLSMISKKPLFSHGLHLLTASALGLSVGACGGGGQAGEPGPAVACGVGTYLDQASNQCRVRPDFNVIVDDFQLGDFAFTAVDVPEQMEVGSPDVRTFSITNQGDDLRAVVGIRYAISPVSATIQELRQKLQSPAEMEALDVSFLGIAIIEDLAPGETRSVQYHLNLPADVDPGLYGMMFAVDEVPLVLGDDGQYRPDPSVNLTDSVGRSRLPDAALIHAPATVIVGRPDRANLRVLFAHLDNAAFEIDQSEAQNEPMFMVTARMSAQAMDITEPVTASLELRLPGHRLDVPGKDLGAAYFAERGLDFDAAPDESVYAYDGSRSFPLLFRDGSGLVASKTYAPRCLEQEESTDTGTISVERCAVVFNEEGRDDIYELHLSPGDARLLAQTRALAALNPDLDQHGEIQGQLVLTLTTAQAEYQDNVADNVHSFGVVFMVPEAEGAASDSDTGELVGGQMGNSWGARGPYPNTWENRVNSRSIGGSWFGGGYNFRNRDTYNHQNGVLIAQQMDTDNSVRARLLQRDVDIVTVRGQSDYGADKPHNSWSASGSVVVMGYTLLSASFNPGYCATSNNVTVCPIFETNSGSIEAEANNAKAAKKKPPAGKGRQIKKEYDWHFMAGPVPLRVIASVGVDSGIKYVGSFVIDRRESVPAYGLQFGAGPYVSLGASVFGGVSIGVARAGVEGNLELFGVEFVPTIRPYVRLGFDAGRACFTAAETGLTTEGTLSFKGPNGSVAIVAYVGVRICFFKCWRVEKKVFSLTIADFRTWSREWTGWDKTWKVNRRPGEPGMCHDAQPPALPPPVAWRSPTSCGGAYCNSSAGGYNRSWPAPMGNILAAYKHTYQNTRSSCTRVQVSGTTEAGWDHVIVYDANGNVLNGRGWSGAINQHLTVCSPQVTVGLETDGSVTREGVLVTFQAQ